MNVNEVIKRPILTEKTYAQMSDGVYTFAVDKRTNKVEVKKAVEYIFDVKVNKVNIFNVGKKPKKLGRFAGFTTAYKKAIIYLADGHSIKLFEDEQVLEAEAETTTETKKVKADTSELEAKVAAKIAKKQNQEEETSSEEK